MNYMSCIYVVGIKIYLDGHQGIQVYLKKAYIKIFLERFQLKHYSPSIAHIMNGDKFHFDQCFKNDFKIEQNEESYLHGV